MGGRLRGLIPVGIVTLALAATAAAATLGGRAEPIRLTLRVSAFQEQGPAKVSVKAGLNVGKAARLTARASRLPAGWHIEILGRSLNHTPKSRTHACAGNPCEWGVSSPEPVHWTFHANLVDAGKRIRATSNDVEVVWTQGDKRGPTELTLRVDGATALIKLNQSFQTVQTFGDRDTKPQTASPVPAAATLNGTLPEPYSLWLYYLTQHLGPADHSLSLSADAAPHTQRSDSVSAYICPTQKDCYVSGPVAEVVISVTWRLP